MVAAENGEVPLTALLLERGAKLEAKTRSGLSALMLAAQYDLPEMVDQLLFKGADPDTAGKDGKSALMIAAGRGHIAPATLLLENGANINRIDKHGKSALIHAADHGNSEDMIRLLTKHGAQVNTPSTTAIPAQRTKW